MKSFTLILSASLLVAAVGCAKKAPEPVQEVTKTVSPFTPAASGQVTPVQVKLWLKADTSLDSLNDLSAEAMSQSDSALYRAAFLKFTSDRESVCLASGLSGGYNEYMWISKNMSKAVNRPLLDSLKLKTL